MSVDKETEEKIQQLQLIEQSLSNMLSQKQNHQVRLMEIETALGEIKNVKSAYRIIGNLMISSKKETLEEELKSKQETTQLRIKALEKQERTIREKASNMQQEVLGKLKNE